MAVDHKSILFIIFFIIFSKISFANDINQSEGLIQTKYANEFAYFTLKEVDYEVLDFLEKKLMQAESSLNKRSAECEKIKDQGHLILDENHIKTFNLTNEEFTSIMYYIYRKNSDACTKNAYYAYHDAALKLVQAKMVYRLNYEKTFIDKIAGFAENPDTYKIFIQYDNIPIEVKKYFEKEIKDTQFPFHDVMSVIRRLYPKK